MAVYKSLQAIKTLQENWVLGTSFLRSKTAGIKEEKTQNFFNISANDFAYNKKVLPQRTRMPLKVLSSEMDPAEIRLIR
jgi:hypothetical protein